jgi:hypothetical protein
MEDLKLSIVELIDRTFAARDTAAVKQKLRVQLKEVSENPLRPRIQVAIILLSQGDIDRIDQFINHACLDWRDTLVAAGLENQDWKDKLLQLGVDCTDW